MINLNPLNHPICLTSPLRLTPNSAWHEHMPFAMLVVALARPRTIVELGTHWGDSYCAFCQAVRELGLDTHCYAVDTWQGDQQAGLYGPEVLDDLRAHHDGPYGGFSKLVQCTFDEALSQFPEGSIDLLHIDGCHAYENVKHDFEYWLPKMSARGLVLLHDTNEHKVGYGVGRLFEELKGTYRHFEFLHGHGLGIVAVGGVTSRELDALLIANETEIDTIRGFFSLLGHRLAADLKLMQCSETLVRQESLIRQLEADARNTSDSGQRASVGTTARLAAVEEDRMRILSSVSWRLTYPIRALGELLLRLK
jgi:O-antigen biosynthesis protein